MNRSINSTPANPAKCRTALHLNATREAYARRKKEQGAGNLKAIIFTVVLVAIVYVSFKMLPTLINEYQFKDGIQDIARQASVNRQSVEQIRQAVLKEAEKDSMPLQAEDIKIENTGKTVHISTDISVTVDLGVYQWTLNFHPEASNEALV
jgi:cell division protein FtsL